MVAIGTEEVSVGVSVSTKAAGAARQWRANRADCRCNPKKSLAVDSLQVQRRMISSTISNCSSAMTAKRPIGVRTTEPVSSAFLHGDAAADLLSLTTFPACACTRYQPCGLSARRRQSARASLGSSTGVCPDVTTCRRPRTVCARIQAGTHQLSAPRVKQRLAALRRRSTARS